ncbi:MAG: hypothetical protein V7K48_31270 [Nostoc sp.]|uniref:hypothetical protein n=1 Tax=Nostoc sp. TaxID=1180 RepID=UPI002FF53474
MSNKLGGNYPPLFFAYQRRVKYPNKRSLNGDVYNGRSCGNFAQSENHSKSQKIVVIYHRH